MNDNNKILWKYAAMATQFLVAIAIAVWGGMQIDKWLQFAGHEFFTLDDHAAIYRE